MSFSTYGSRVDLHGWGTDVASLGYGDLIRVGNDINQAYTAVFAGTSSASPIVASACVAIQSYARAQLGRPLAPHELRDLLVQTGKPQADPAAGHIGPLPNLRAALEPLGLTPTPPGGLMINEIFASPLATTRVETAYRAAAAMSSVAGRHRRDCERSWWRDDLGFGRRTRHPASWHIDPRRRSARCLRWRHCGAELGRRRDRLARHAVVEQHGDTITVAKNGTTLATATFGSDGGDGQSLVRATELDPSAAFVRHKTVSTEPASPGKRANGSPL